MPRPTQDPVRRIMHFAYGGITLYAEASQLLLLYIIFVTPCRQSYNPSKNWFGLFRVRSPLLTESLLFSFPLVTKMFQFTRYHSNIPMYSVYGNKRLILLGFPIRKSLSHSTYPALQSLSQVIASFIVFQTQGIHL